jgi:hypothetical protein
MMSAQSGGRFGQPCLGEAASHWREATRPFGMMIWISLASALGLCLTGPKRWTVEDRVERIDVVADAV